ncbi:MAG: DUF3016 domain-containing protein [Pseudomonadota bacterium]|nr:DUF3016 domain-containing protein [Pseudomonadota bacterium]
MNKHLPKALLAAACGLALSTGANAATLVFEHGDPNDFRDIRATDQSQTRFEQRVLKDIEEHFRKEAAALPENQTLHVNVTDLDLAGFVEYFHQRYPMGLRVIRNVDIPQMELSYELRDGNDAVIQSGEENVKDLGFRFTQALPRRDDPLRYEKWMISEWFDKTFGS